VIRTTEAPAGARARSRARIRFSWIYGPLPDLFIALCWVPIYFAAHALTVRHGAANDHLLGNLLSGAFLLSLLHQPLTLALIYGDRNQFELRKKLFTWSPFVAVGLVSVAVLLNLWIIIPVAAVWNLIHTLNQRYGLSRIYSRKAGYGSARLDRWTVFAWMFVALLVVGSTATTLHQLARVMLDDTNANGIKTLTSVRPYALWLVIPVAAFALALTIALVRQELAHRDQANGAKWVYQASGALLILGIAIDPLAGFIAYVAAHAIEYFVVVDETMISRYGRTPDRTTVLGRLVYQRGRRATFFVVFLGAFALLLSSRLTNLFPGQTYTITLYSVGILHFWYDSFIWKLRKPAVAANFGIRAA
jgi:hypothetical protein